MLENLPAPGDEAVRRTHTRSLIDRLHGSEAVTECTGAKDKAIRAWCNDIGIPPKFWMDLIDLAKDQGWELTADMLRATRPVKPAKAPPPIRQPAKQAA
jgi:hypothetical protein